MGIRAFKGFDKDLKCRGFQYKIGAEFKHEGNAVPCESGFHSCEYPFDVFSYYQPSDSRYCEVEIDGDMKRDGGDSKIASTKIRIGAEIGLGGLIQAGVKFILDHVKWDDNQESNTGYQSAATNTGNRSAATNTGYQSAATNTGYQSAATNTGDQSAASVEGKESVAVATGYESKAKGAMGCWLVLAEWDEVDDEYHIVDVQSARVDGERIKADTWYILQGGQFVEASQE